MFLFVMESELCCYRVVMFDFDYVVYGFGIGGFFDKIDGYFFVCFSYVI